MGKESVPFLGLDISDDAMNNDHLPTGHTLELKMVGLIPIQLASSVEQHSVRTPYVLIISHHPYLMMYSVGLTVIFRYATI